MVVTALAAGSFASGMRISPKCGKVVGGVCGVAVAKKGFGEAEEVAGDTPKLRKEL